MFPNHLPLAWDWGLLGFGCVGDGLVGALWVLAPRERACTRRKAQGFKAFALCARVFWVFAFNARSGSLPLPPGVRGVVEVAEGFLGLFSFRAPCLGPVCAGTGSWARAGCLLVRDRACARRKAQGFKAFALCAMGFWVFAFNARSGSLPLALWGAPSGSLMNRCVTGGS